MQKNTIIEKISLKKTPTQRQKCPNRPLWATKTAEKAQKTAIVKKHYTAPHFTHFGPLKRHSGLKKGSLKMQTAPILFSIFRKPEKKRFRRVAYSHLPRNAPQLLTIYSFRKIVGHIQKSIQIIIISFSIWTL